MTHGILQDKDAFKINIRQEDDQSNNCKEFFEKGLSALLADEHFLLLYVPEIGGRMQIVRPASDPYHRQRMIQKINEAKGVPSFYYALSHLWGLTENNRYHWNEIADFVDDEDGQPVKPVSMRPAKRDTLLALLQDHPDSYWWIDVLCARTDTPLDIMGDIYSCCLECVAMIDGDPNLIPQLYTLMMDVKQEFPTYYNMDRNDILNCKQNDKRLSKATELVFALMQRKWWKRVWTWQEMALPFGDVRLVPESGTHQPLSKTITVDALLDYFQANFRVDHVAHALEPIDSETGLTNAMTLHAWFTEILHARKSNEHRTGKKRAQEFSYLVSSFSDSPRRCMDPADYVYGVLGVFQFKIPRMNDPNAVWHYFLSELDNYMETTGMKNDKFSGKRITGINDNAYRIDLRKAKDMADVYKDDLLEMTFC
ncbi:hypothetical protein O0I10_011780 [Lichtheimia ornata]|uniref:Heterokaryon incompatibility domain-containing protein n=1 Tax=Lichtheimia ornata TaxID=688661 RepID=A0AAD7UU89_9FUNG|nr:uncharacterized protein O0I10_011780 [Lichtheimia ornata]KAJ8652575.1 hypothetical protein O0I10_011780 [Lichtheimia ornata]